MIACGESQTWLPHHQEAKGRFSQFGQLVCDHKDVGGDQKGIDDFPQAIIPAIETLDRRHRWRRQPEEPSGRR